MGNRPISFPVLYALDLKIRPNGSPELISFSESLPWYVKLRISSCSCGERRVNFERTREVTAAKGYPVPFLKEGRDIVRIGGSDMMMVPIFRSVRAKTPRPFPGLERTL